MGVSHPRASMQLHRDCRMQFSAARSATGVYKPRRVAVLRNYTEYSCVLDTRVHVKVIVLKNVCCVSSQMRLDCKPFRRRVLIRACIGQGQWCE